ncbi:MAG: hypothetical protein JSS28_03815 [Proteobacteria bacterium]|nr:hypothetical protein [Pseudomonadota bacterium]
MSNKTRLAFSFAVLFGASWGGAYAQVQTQSPVFGAVLEYPTSGCGGAVLQVPLPGKQLVPQTAGIPVSATSFYGRAAARHATWLTSLQCTHTGITHELKPSTEGMDTVGINNGYVSGNWSGYQISNTAQYTQSGWTIPAVVKPNPGYSSTGYYSSTWTGIGGGFNAGSGPLIQAGSSQQYYSTGSVYYFWHEIVGGSTDTGGEVHAFMPAHPGDAAGSAAIWTPDTKFAGRGQVTLGVCDFTAGGPCANIVIGGEQQNDTPTPGNTTEWIVEAPSSGGGVLPLADFDSVTFSNASWASDYVGDPGTTYYTIAQGTSPSSISLQQYIFQLYQYVAVPDVLNGTGDGFTDYYLQPQKVNGN